MIERGRNGDSQGVCAVRQQQCVFRVAITCPFLCEFVRQRLWQTFHRTQKYAHELRSKFQRPFAECWRRILRPGPIARIANRQSSVFRQLALQPAGTTGKLRQRFDGALDGYLCGFTNNSFQIRHTNNSTRSYSGGFVTRLAGDKKKRIRS